MPIQDTDNLIVGRGSDTFKIEYGQVKSDITSGIGGGGNYVELDDGGTKQVIESAGLGLSDGTTENITLGSDGSASFNRYVSVTTESTGAYFAASADVGNDGRSAFKTDSSAGTTTFLTKFNGDTWIGGDIAGNQPNISLNANGSAEFAAGKITFADNGYASFDRRADAGYGVVNFNSSVRAIDILDNGGTSNTKLNYDGSATFAGKIVNKSEVTVGDRTGGVTDDYSALFEYGQLYLNKKDDATVNPESTDFLRCLQNGGQVMARINGDGSAEFAGLMTVNEAVRSDRTGPTQACFSARLNDAENAVITADGSAKFASGNIELTSGSIVRSRRADGNTVFAAYNGSDWSNNTVSIDADGSALFAGDVTTTSNNGIKFEGTGTDTQFYSLGKDSTGGKLQIKRADAVLMSVAYNGNSTFSGKVTAAAFDLESLNTLP